MRFFAAFSIHTNRQCPALSALFFQFCFPYFEIYVDEKGKQWIEWDVACDCNRLECTKNWRHLLHARFDAMRIEDETLLSRRFQRRWYIPPQSLVRRSKLLCTERKLLIDDIKRDSHTIKRLNWRRSLVSIVNGPHQYSRMQSSGFFLFGLYANNDHMHTFQSHFVGMSLCDVMTDESSIWRLPRRVSSALPTLRTTKIKIWIDWRVNASARKRNEGN